MALILTFMLQNDNLNPSTEIYDVQYVRYNDNNLPDKNTLVVVNDDSPDVSNDGTKPFYLPPDGIFQLEKLDYIVKNYVPQTLKKPKKQGKKKANKDD